jgi:hypothetical protein
VSLTKARHKELRYEALAGISNGKPRCNCCGNKNVWALVFDHINGGGTAHRKANSWTNTLRLVRQHYKLTGEWDRDTYQVLCALCNHGKRVNDNVCPCKEVNMNKPVIEALKSYGKVFSAVLLSLFLASGADVFSVDFADLKVWLSTAIASVLPLIITAIDPNDHRFGNKS